MLEAEGLQRDGELGRRRAREELVGDPAAQHVRLQARRVDDDVGQALDRLEHLALQGDAALDARGRRQRVAPARLLKAGEQRVVGGVEEEHAMAQPERLEVLEHGAQRLEVVAAAHVGDDRGALDLRALVDEELDQRADHLGRQVVDAEVARVLEDVHGRRLAGARVAVMTTRSSRRVSAYGRGGPASMTAGSSRPRRPRRRRPRRVGALTAMSCSLSGSSDISVNRS